MALNHRSPRPRQIRGSAALTVIAIGALVAMLAGCRDGRGHPSPPPANATVLIVSFNVCAEKCPFLASWSEERAPRVVERIAAQRPAVVAVQEAGGGPRLRLLDRLMAERGYQRVVGRAGRYIYLDPEAVTVVRSGVVTAQRTPHSKRTRLPWADVRDRRTGRELTVAGVHLSAFDSADKDRDRLYEIQTLTKVLADREHVLMIGDTNSLSRRHRAGNDADHDRWRVNSWLTRHGWAVASGGGTYIQQPTDFRLLGPLAFDRAYARGLTVIRFRVLPGGAKDSDHRAVVVTVR